MLYICQAILEVSDYLAHGVYSAEKASIK